MTLKVQFGSRVGGGVGVMGELRVGMLGGEGDRGSEACLLYTSPSPRDINSSRMPSSA